MKTMNQNEVERLKEFYPSDIFNMSEEKDFDDIVKLASQICGTPVALIGLSDRDRERTNARNGFEGHEVPRDISFYRCAVQQEGRLVITDSFKGEGIHSDVLIADDPRARPYARVLVKSCNGHNVGALCVLDKRNSDLTEGQFTALKMLANQVMKLLELRVTIKETKDARELASKNELRFRALAENAPLGIYQTSADGRGVYVNPKWCELANVSEADALSTGWIRAISEEDRHNVLCTWTHAMDNRIDFNFEFRFQKNKSGEVRWVKSKASPMYTEAGVFQGYVGTLEDITARKVAEKKLKESELKYRLISANSRDVIALLTTGPVPVLTFLSPSIKEVLGYEPEELIGKSLFDIVHADDLETFKNETHVKPITGATRMRQNRLIKKSGSILWVEIVSGPAFDEDGKEMGIMASIRNIHEQKLAEFKLEESERMFNLISANSLYWKKYNKLSAFS